MLSCHSHVQGSYLPEIDQIRRRATTASKGETFNPFTCFRKKTTPQGPLAMGDLHSSSAAINEGQSTHRSDTLSMEAGINGEKIPPRKRNLTITGQLKASLFSWINILLVFVPVGIATHYAGINP
jgi:hypothetical protein